VWASQKQCASGIIFICISLTEIQQIQTLEYSKVTHFFYTAWYVRYRYIRSYLCVLGRIYSEIVTYILN
jgi:hypothetical protein